MSAPAGSGKTLLLRSWGAAARMTGRVAWVALDDEEHDAQRFWLAVADALRGTGSGAPLVRGVIAAPGLDGWALAEQLLQDLAPLGEPLVLVVDDLHQLGPAEARAQLELLVLHSSPRLRFVFATRSDPRLGLHRLRLAGELTELRAEDLRFSHGEARALLEGAAGAFVLAAPADVLDEPLAGVPTGTPLLDPLSRTELRVLRYLPTHLSMAEIAGELHVSLNTIRTHMRRLLTKCSPSVAISAEYSGPTASSLRVRLRTYQVFGAQYAIDRKRVILGDEMGLGKTIEAIAVMAHLTAKGERRFLPSARPACFTTGFRRSRNTVRRPSTRRTVTARRPSADAHRNPARSSTRSDPARQHRPGSTAASRQPRCPTWSHIATLQLLIHASRY